MVKPSKNWLMSNLKKIKVNQFLIAFNSLKQFHENGHDPLPEIGNIDAITYALDYPFINVFGKVAFWGFYKKASCYFFTFAKGHLFGNGNKRCGVLATTLFYEINDRECNISQDDMYNLALYIAKSDATKKEETIDYIAKILKNNK